MTRKTPTRADVATSRRPDPSRGLTSAHIREHLAAFEASGGRVEVLGTTQVLKRVGDAGRAPVAK